MVFENLLNLIVDGIATITGRILNHPAVQTAVANSIEAGFQQICASPDLHHHIDRAYLTLNQHSAEDAEDLGKDLSRNIGHFWKGVFSTTTNSSSSDNDKERTKAAKMHNE